MNIEYVPQAYSGWFSLHFLSVCRLIYILCCDKVHMGSGMIICTTLHNSFLYICYLYSLCFLWWLCLFFIWLFWFYVKALTRTRAATSFMLYALCTCIGCLCVTMPSVLSLLNKQTNKKITASAPHWDLIWSSSSLSGMTWRNRTN